MRLEYAPYRLKFRSPARTSREVMTEKLTCFLKIYDEADPGHYGIGEAAIFPGLSPEANSEYEYKLLELVANIALGRPTDLSRHSSIQFGLEQAITNYSAGGGCLYFPTPFTEGKKSIDINGLVWMGNAEEMMRRAEEKLEAGFHCLKFKIGALDWDREHELLKAIRKRAPELEIRVDANGGFTPEIAMERLDALARLGVSSIEQPLSKGMIGATAALCRNTPVPIALDEELIGIYSDEERRALLHHVKPQYIVLKPALCGGFSGAEAWIAAAREEGIGWWVTSALESNIGLNALAQWTATLHTEMAQGLGTGALYLNNFDSPLRLDGEKLSSLPLADTYNRPVPAAWDAQLDTLDWRG